MNTRLRDFEKSKEELIAERDSAIAEINVLKQQSKAEQETTILLQKNIQNLGREIKRRNAYTALLDLSILSESEAVVCSELIEIIYRGVQAPEQTCIRVSLGTTEVSSDRFLETQWRLALDVQVAERVVGMIELFYFTFNATLADSGFVFEERQFLDTLSAHLGRLLSVRERLQQSGHLGSVTGETAPIPEGTLQIEKEKQRIKKDIVTNIDSIVLPLLRRLQGEYPHVSYLKLLEGSLQNMASSFGRRVTANLTAREVEICNMIRNGLTGKDIANLLSISFGTVEVHRNNIRKKLKLVKQNVSLSTYLKSL